VVVLLQDTMACQTKNVGNYDDDEEDDKVAALDEGDIALLKAYGQGPYTALIKGKEKDIEGLQKGIHELIGIKESDTGLSLPSEWDLVSDKQMMQEEQPLQVARCTKIMNAGQDDAKYVINVKQIAKFVVALGEKVAPTDIEEDMRVGVDRQKYSIMIPLPPRIDPTVSLMQVEEKPDVTYDDVGGARESMEKLREVRQRLTLSIEYAELPSCSGLTRTRRPPRRPACPAGRRAAAAAPGAVRHAGHRPAQGSALLRPPRHGQDPLRACGGQPHGRLLHPRHRQRAGTEVRRRGRAHGAGAVLHGPVQEGVHRLLR
jgi:hypothetical protein